MDAPRQLRLDDVKVALSGRGPGRPAEDDVPGARRAAVLVPLFEDRDGLRVLLTRRSSTLRHHRGDVAFPGGRVDHGETDVAAALREAEEEIGLSPDAVEILGELDGLATVVSRFVITPIVGQLAERPVTTPNPAEIARVFDVRVTELLDAEVYRQELWEMPGGLRPVHFFELEDETVWGATARILTQLLTLLVLPDAAGRA